MRRRAGFDFGQGAEGVARAMDEESGGFDGREVSGARLLRLLRRVKRVGEKEKAIDEAGLGRCEFGGEDGGLATAVGVSTEEDAAGSVVAHEVGGGVEAETVACG